MDYLIVDLALHRLNKSVKNYLQKLNRPYMINHSNEVIDHLRLLMKHNKITYEEYLIIHARIILNQFCYKLEEEFEQEIRSGFLYHSERTRQFYFGAGANYPQEIKERLNRETKIIRTEYFDETPDDFFILPEIDNHPEKQTPCEQFLAEIGCHGFMSLRLQKNELFIGTFDVFFNHSDIDQERLKNVIESRIQPVIDELYEIRKETHIIHDTIFEQLKAISF